MCQEALGPKILKQVASWLCSLVAQKKLKDQPKLSLLPMNVKAVDKAKRHKHVSHKSMVMGKHDNDKAKFGNNALIEKPKVENDEGRTKVNLASKMHARKHGFKDQAVKVIDKGKIKVCEGKGQHAIGWVLKRTKH
ncbi:hypothetical protein GOP47_0019363 [Adiantum capillus-veneris]|uniref:Uncharacterized protein n=1 Tax=Adiantum capillus-veneris TaxID=13818 RepID=A0A9D4UBW3_ADICA|nr:hypothetical protein GOP47_0019363 [Adiantum capillus-veneris]